MTLETVIATPLALLLVFLAIHTALWFHARNTALAAAQEGVRVARAHHGNLADGHATALRFAQTTGDGFLLSPRVDTRGSTATTIVIEVRGKSISLVPWVSTTISQVAHGPRERFTTPQQL